MSFEPILFDNEFSWMDEPERGYIEAMQVKIAELLPTREWPTEDSLLNAAADALGNADERYSQVYVCLWCRMLYHSDYSTNTDPDRDFCDAMHEVAWLDANPAAEYHGDLRDEVAE